MDSTNFKRLTPQDLQQAEQPEPQDTPASKLLSEALALMKEHPLECAVTAAVATSGLALLIASRGRGFSAIAESAKGPMRSIIPVERYNAAGYRFVQPRIYSSLNPAEYQSVVPKNPTTPYDAAGYKWVTPRLGLK